VEVKDMDKVPSTTMARRDLEVIARIISRLPDEMTRDEVAWAFAGGLTSTNERFDVPRFVKACGATS
jgi:hypothetical protein